MSKIIESIKDRLRPVYRCVKNSILDKRAEVYLKRAKNRRFDRSEVRIGFLVFEPESWDKLQPVYERMLEDDRIKPELIVIPSYNINFDVGVTYGYELDFFKKLYGDVLTAFDDSGNLIDLKSKEYDYVFYQDPYNDHYPKKIRCNQVVKYSRVCYVPYGYTTLVNFMNLVRENRSFFRNVFAYFPDTDSNGEVIEQIYSKSIKAGFRNVVHLGYPSLEKYLKMDNNSPVTNITWTPRWSYDAKVGGSHFLEYKDDFIGLGREYSLLLRPHPMLFKNLVNSKILSETEAEEYRTAALNKGVVIDDRGPIDEVIKKTGILITDISSVIPSFFLTGKPIIYCDSHFEPNDEFKEMLRGIYVAQNWNEVKEYLESIIKGNDYKRGERSQVIEKYRGIHEKSAERIIDWLVSNKG